MRSTLLAMNTAFLVQQGIAADYNWNTLQGCQKSCADLSEQFGSLLRFPWEDDYVFWDTKQQDYSPACRVQPLNSQDVSDILKTVTSNQCPFAIKSGGHAREHDDSNSVGGVTMDLQLMRSVSVSKNKDRARLGAGHTLYSAYSALEQYGLTFLGGRVDSVGIGGFTLGGGFSNLSPKYGLAMDNVFEYELVLANESIVTASEFHNPDLYFALRGGGGNNFGAVTSFEVRVVDQGLSWGGSRTYSDDKAEILLLDSVGWGKHQ